jgi:MFS family permease
MPPHDPAFDLVVARISLGIELCQYILVVLSTNTQMWIAATLLSSFGGGFTPSVQALAVELSSRNSHAKSIGSSAENFGQLFGALGVLQALASQVIGPTLFGTIFVASVESYPKAIFVTSGGIVALGLLVLSLIRVNPPVVDEEREPLLRAHDE